MKTQVNKNKAIADTMRETYARRKGQTCVTIKCKVDRSSLRNDQKETLKQMFLEAKWVYNFALANNMIYGHSHKDFKFITRRDEYGNDIPVIVRALKSSMIDKILTRMQDSLKSIETRKKKGYKTGELKFKSEYKSLQFKQYGITHYIKGNRIKFQGIKRPIRVSGLKQLNKLDNPEITTMDLIFDGYDYWVNIACYVDNASYYNKYSSQNKLNYLGLDLGIASTITLSNGEKIDVTVEQSERLRKLKKKQKRQTKYSNNWYKTKSLIAKENAKLKRKKNDLTNKIIFKLFSTADRVITQNDNIFQWKIKKKDKNGNKISTKSTKKVHNSILGRLKHRLAENKNCSMLNKYWPTSKYCRHCGFRHNSLTLEDRVFVCPNCGHTENRDIHAANNMIFFYQKYKDTVGTTDTSKLRGCEKVIEYKLNGAWSSSHRPEEGIRSLA